jgi:hypothetical protein
MTNASGVYRCCLASTPRAARSTGFIAPTHPHLTLRCPRAGITNPGGCGTFFLAVAPSVTLATIRLSSAYLRYAKLGERTNPGRTGQPVHRQPTRRIGECRAETIACFRDRGPNRLCANTLIQYAKAR